jgi:hypothetical protein
MGPARQQLQASLEMVLCFGRGDVAGFLKLVPQMQDFPPFEPALLQGKLQEASHMVGPEQDKSVVQHGLLYLAAQKAGNQKLAEEQWQGLLTALGKGRASMRKLADMLAGRKPMTYAELSALPMDLEAKRVLLVVAAKRRPELAKETLALARKLDYTPDITSLCLRKILE